MPDQHFYVDKDNVDVNIVVSLFTQAEVALKKIERTHETLTIPTINQLRYAGCHLARYLKDPANKEEITRAANHCQRAIYDAYETGILYFLTEIDTFENDYRKTVITDVLIDWVESKKIVNECRNFIARRTEIDKENHFKECEDTYDKLKSIIEKATHARQELNKIIKKERKQSFILILTFILVILAILAFFGYNSYQSFNSNKTIPIESTTVPTLK
jgi:preprotein translocase subunit SecE